MIALLLFNFFSLLSSSDPQVFCDDSIGSYNGNGGEFTLYNTEFPLALNGETSEKYSIYHPCYSLTGGSNYKNSIFGILEQGTFSSTVCRRKCAHFVNVEKPSCSERRAPPSWNVYMFSAGSSRKVDCSDWDLPLTKKGMIDGVYLRHSLDSYESKPFKLDNSSLAYTDNLHINGYHVSNAMSENSSVTDMVSEMDYIIEKHPEISHIAFGNLNLNLDEDTVAHLNPPTLMSKMANAQNLESLTLARVHLTDTSTEPSKDMTKIKSVTFKEVKLSTLPSWLQKANLQFLEFYGTVTDTVNIDVLEKLSELEHFILKGGELTKISKNFLKSSSKLISLTLECNHISTIEENAFDKFTNLQYLNLAGNRLITVPEKLFAKLDNLIVVDLKTYEPSRLVNEAVGARLTGFDEHSTYCFAALKAGNDSGTLLKAPEIPRPEKIKFLDIRGQKNIIKEDNMYLEQFQNVEILNIGKLGLTTLQNYSLETLCNLYDLNAMDNPFSDSDWISEEMFANVHLEHFRIGASIAPASAMDMLNKITDVSDVLIAYMRSSMSILNGILNQTAGKAINPGSCGSAAMNVATMYGYTVDNASCEAYSETSFSNIIHRGQTLHADDMMCIYFWIV